MKAHEIPVGAGFLGEVDRDEWRSNWKAGKPFPGELIYVSLIKPQAEYGNKALKELIRLHSTHLPKGAYAQLDNSDSMWVAGVRESRSKKVRLFAWESRPYETLLQRVHKHLTDEHLSNEQRFSEALKFLEIYANEEREVPYL